MPEPYSREMTPKEYEEMEREMGVDQAKEEFKQRNQDFFKPPSKQ
jgi:hypothetical protein